MQIDCQTKAQAAGQLATSKLYGLTSPDYEECRTPPKTINYNGLTKRGSNIWPALSASGERVKAVPDQMR